MASPYIATLASGIPIPGPTGPRGAQGPTGPRGPIGLMGPQGVVGPKGDTGSMGPTGAMGPVGPQGPRGSVGPQGAQGVPSTALDLKGVAANPAGLPAGVEPGTCWFVQSTSTIWCWDGVAWIDLGLVTALGPPGPQGSQGIQGQPGPTGATGSIGPQGVPGIQGPVGSQGPQGAGIHLLGTVANVSNLPMTGNSDGDVYLVTATGHMYVWGLGVWNDLGMLAGPQGVPGPQGQQGPPGPQGPAGSSQTQTPWLTDIDASNHGLTNLGGLVSNGAIDVRGPSYLRRDMNGWNDFGNVQLTLTGTSNLNQDFWIGYDTSGNNAVLQGAVNGVQWSNLLLCPGGGAVGIGLGARAPEAELHVYGRLLIENSEPWCLGLRGSGNVNQTWIATNASADLLIADTNGSVRSIFTQDGRVGIGTTAPQQMLHVLGNAQIDGQIWAGGNAVLTNPFTSAVNANGQNIGGIGNVGAASVSANYISVTGQAHATDIISTDAYYMGPSYQGMPQFYCPEISVDPSQLKPGCLMFSQVNTGPMIHGLLVWIRHANGQLYDGALQLNPIAG